MLKWCPGVGKLTLASLKMSNSPGVAPPPTLGLNIDSCIKYANFTKSLFYCEIDMASNISDEVRWTFSVIIQPMGISHYGRNRKFEQIRCMESRQSYFSASLPSSTLRFHTPSRPFVRRPRAFVWQTNAKIRLFCSLTRDSITNEQIS